MEKLRLAKSYEIKRAQLNAMLEMENEVKFELPDEVCSQDILEGYLVSQAQSVSQLPVASISHDNPVKTNVTQSLGQSISAQNGLISTITESNINANTTKSNNTNVTFSHAGNIGTFSSTNPFIWCTISARIQCCKFGILLFNFLLFFTIQHSSLYIWTCLD